MLAGSKGLSYSFAVCFKKKVSLYTIFLYYMKRRITDQIGVSVVLHLKEEIDRSLGRECRLCPTSGTWGFRGLLNYQLHLDNVFTACWSTVLVFCCTAEILLGLCHTEKKALLGYKIAIFIVITCLSSAWLLKLLLQSALLLVSSLKLSSPLSIPSKQNIQRLFLDFSM